MSEAPKAPSRMVEAAGVEPLGLWKPKDLEGNGSRNNRTRCITRGSSGASLEHGISSAVGFVVHDKRNVYSPIFHGKLEDDQELIRKGIVDLLTGKRALSTISWVMPGQAPIQVAQVPPPAAPPAVIAEQPPPRQELQEAQPVAPPQRPHRPRN